MLDKPHQLLEYHVVDRAAIRRGRARRLKIASVLLAIIVVIALMVLLRVRTPTPYSRSGWTYPERVGVDHALKEINFAVIAYAEANHKLPDNLQSVKPYLHGDRRKSRNVTSDEIFPYVVLIPAKDPKPYWTLGGRFTLLVYLKKSGNMDWNATAAYSEDTSKNFQNYGLWFDDEIIIKFGPDTLKELKQLAYELP